MTKCRDCKEPLNAGAARCKECGSFQDWRHAVDRTQVALGLVLLILTVLALEPVRKLFFGSAPDLEAKIVAADEQFVTLVISNFGGGPGIVSELYVTVEPPGSGSWTSAITFPNVPDPIIRPGESRVVRFEHRGQIPRVAVPGEVDQGQLRGCNLVYQFASTGDRTIIQKSDRFRCDKVETQGGTRGSAFAPPPSSQATSSSPAPQK
jgi:hypothetical protein